MKKYKLNINFEQLKEQKSILINMIQDWSEADDEQQVLDSDMVEGILHLIDNIQDQAVSIHGLSEEEVFNFEREGDMIGEWKRLNPIYDQDWLDESDKLA